MYDGMRVYKALVVSASATTGDVYVKIPSLLGPSNTVAISKANLIEGPDGWVIPEEGSQVLVAVDDDLLTNVYLVSVPTVSENLKSVIDSKGDLFVGTANDTVGKLPVGTDGKIIVADSTKTTGLDWVRAGQLPVYNITTTSTNVYPDLTYAGALVRSTATSSVVVQISSDSVVNFAVGTQITIVQEGTGLVTVTAGSGVTIRATPGYKLRTQYSVATLIKVATNLWILFGDLVL